MTVGDNFSLNSIKIWVNNLILEKQVSSEEDNPTVNTLTSVTDVDDIHFNESFRHNDSNEYLFS